MAYTVEWYNDQHTAILRMLRPGWTWDDFNQSYLDAYELVRSVKHRVDLVSDYTESPTLPEGGGGMMERFGTIWAQHPPNMGIFIIVAADEFQRSMGEIFTRTFGGSQEIARYVRTRQEADEVLAERSQT